MGPRRERGGFLKEAGALALGLALLGLVVLVVWKRDAWSGPGADPAPGEPPTADQPTDPAGSNDPTIAEGFHYPLQQPTGKRPSAEELRKRYPYVSLASRLDYEGARAAGAEPADLPAATVKRLDAVEQSFQEQQTWSRRVHSLAKLHSDQVGQFVSEDGFGWSRMLPMTAPVFLELAEAPPIPFANLASLPPQREGARVELPPAGGPADVGGGARVPSLEMLGTFHDGGRFDFLNPSAFGHVKDRDHVAGFLPHQFRAMPELREPRAPPQKPVKAKERWAVRRLELVSLLKHERPAVYVSDTLPRMDELKKKAKTRPLSEFEDKALAAVRDGEDLVAEATADRIHLLGSLRATKQCLDCHQVHRGDLLGAFSYELQRDPAGK